MASNKADINIKNFMFIFYNGIKPFHRFYQFSDIEIYDDR